MTDAVDHNLTAKERFWYEHIRAAQQSDQTLVQYAHNHSLKVTTFYNYRSVLRKKGVLESVPVKSFIQARVAQEAALLQAMLILPAGIRVQLPCRGTELVAILKGLCG